MDCAACEGRGQRKQDCWHCKDGTLPCPMSSPYRPVKPARWSDEWAPRAVYSAFGRQLGEINKDIFQPPKIRTLGSSRTTPKRARAKAGELLCPAECRGGKLSLAGDWLDCKLCRAGKFRCLLCKKGRVECARCEGRGVSLDACESCAGLGRVPDPQDLALETCPWCLGTSSRACNSCDQNGQWELPCTDCLDLIRLPCENCRGIEKLACATCKGCGRSGRGKEKCATCRGKGTAPCRACEDGLQTCASCQETPREPVKCTDCDATKEHPCNGCQLGSYLAWERTAEAYIGLGDADRAEDWATEAVRRCEKRYGRALEIGPPFPEPDEGQFRRAVEEELEGELERLEKLRKKARALRR